MRDSEHNCAACPVAEHIARRDFLRDAALGALTALGALAATPGAVAGLSITTVTGRGERAAKEYPIPASDGVAIDKAESVIIARHADRAYAFSLACPHQNTALRWQERNRRFQCPRHNSRYQPDGVFIEGRATRSMDRFAVARHPEASHLVVNLDALYRQDQQPREWEAAFVLLTPEK